MSERLRECPFCGCVAEIGVFGIIKEFAIGCSDCPAMMEGFSSVDEAAEAWNNRCSIPKGKE